MRLTELIKAWTMIFRSRTLIVCFGFASGALFIYLTARKIEWEKVAVAFAGGDWLPWLPLAVVCYIAGMLARGYRLRMLVEGESSISISTASNIVAVGYATNNILPARLGEFARAAMLAERTGLPYILCLTVTFLERLLDGMAILFLAVAGSTLIPVAGWMQQTALAAALLFLIAMVGVVFITMLPQSAVSLASKLSSPLGSKWHGKAIALVTQVNRGFGCLRSFRSGLQVMAASLFVWLLEALFFMLLLPCFAIPMGFIWAVLTMSFTNLGILIPSSPGYVGLYHFICSKTLIAVTSVAGTSPGTVTPVMIDMSTAVSYAVVVHLVFFVTVTVWGVIALAKYSFEVGSTVALAWEAKPVTSLPALEIGSSSLITTLPDLSNRVAPATTQFWSGLCECFVPETHKPRNREVYQRALSEATIFLLTELDCLPFRLKVLFKIGITGFKTIVALTNFRFLCDIPMDKRIKLVEAWAFGPVDVTRKFMKPIRSLFLFAYYENTDVKEHLANLSLFDQDRLEASETASGGD